MSIQTFFKSLISTSTRRVKSRQRISKRQRSYRLMLEALENRTLLALVVPPLNSLPGAFQTLYLDFDGAAPFLWDGAGTGDPYVVRGPSHPLAPSPVPAFTTDADALNFSDAELTNIRNIHAWVAEKFSPFSINVTTVNPGVVVDSRNMTCLIGGSDRDWYAPEKPAGGVADRDGFFDGGENTCFVFSGDVTTNLERFIGESIAHEAGHAVGLSHQRNVLSLIPLKIDEYYGGDAIRAPIMGGSSNNTSARGIWWVTNNPAWAPGQNSLDFPQDDLIALTQDAPQRLFYRNDDFSTNIPDMVFDSAGVLSQQKGIIERNGDIDGFRFRATGTRASFQIKNAPFGGMLAPSASIRLGGQSTLIPVNLTLTNTGATIEATNLVPGTNYVLLVAGQGQYGDIGQYTIDGLMPQFAGFNAATGIVRVNGFDGNNNVTLRTSGNTLIVEDSVNGGPIVRQSFPFLSAITRVDVILGAGADTLNVARLLHLNNTAVDVYSSLGGGFDTLRLGDTGNSFSTFNVSRFEYEWTQVNDGTSRVQDSNAERVELIGTQGPDVFNVNSQDVFSTLHVFGHGDGDRLYLGPQVLAAHRPTVIFDGGGGSDTLEMDGSTLRDPQQFVVFNNTVQRFIPGVFFAAETQFGTAVETVLIRGGSGGNSFDVGGVRAGMTVALSGGDGDDEFRVGNRNPLVPLPFSTIRGIVSAVGYGGIDRLVVDDSAWGSVGNYTIDWSGSIGSGSLKNTFVNNEVRFDATLERVDFHSRNGETTRLTSALLAQEFHLFNGPGNGVGTLIVDDRFTSGGAANIALYADRIVRNAIVSSWRPIHYSGYEALTIFSNDRTNAINVFGTSPDITQQTTIRSGARDDVVTLYPHGTDGTSVPTIATPLGFFGGGGLDTFRVDDTASAAPLDYLFNNAGGVSTASIFGLGPAAVGAFNDVETIEVLAGAGNDTYTVDSFQTGVAFRISGGAGADQFLIRDLGATSLRRYDLGVSQMVGSETVGSLVDHINLLKVRYEHVESVTLEASNVRNFFKISGTPADTSVHIRSGTSNDTFDVGSAAVLGPGNSLRNMRGPLSIDGQVGVDQLIVNDQGTSTRQIYSLEANRLTRTDADLVANMPPITFAAVETITLNVSGGGSSVAVLGTAAGSSLTVNGYEGASDRFEVAASSNAILGQVFLQGQTGDNDVAQYEDSQNTVPHVYTLTSSNISRANSAGTMDLAQVNFSGLIQMILYAPRLGGSTVNVRSVDPGTLASVVVADHDTVTIGSQNRRLNNIGGPVAVRSYSPDDRVILTVDDSANPAGIPKNVRLTPPESPTDLGNHIEGFAPNTIYWNLGPNATVGLLGGRSALDQITFDDQGTTTPQYYSLEPGELTRTDVNSVQDMARISFTAFEGITLNMSSGGSAVFVNGTAAGTATTIHSQPGSFDAFALGFGADLSAILGPVSVYGQAADNDFAYYYDYLSPTPQTYRFLTDPVDPAAQRVERSGIAPFTYYGGNQIVFYAPQVGGSRVNIRGVPAQIFLNMIAGNGDNVTLGSRAPNLGGSLANIQGPVAVVSYSPDDAVTLVLDDSGNGDLTPKNVTLTPTGGFTDFTQVEGFAPKVVQWNLGANASIALRGGAADETFALKSTAFAPAISIHGGGGVNTLDYSAIEADSGSGPVARYLGEGNAEDAVAGNHGTLVGGVAFAEGRVGQAFSFNGLDSYVQVPNSPSFESGIVSVEAWVNSSTVAANGVILAKGAFGSPHNAASYSLYTGNNGGLSFYIYNGNDYVLSPDAGVGVWDGAWHHVVGAYDGVTVRLYVDGQEVGTGTPEAGPIAYGLPGSSDLFIGGYTLNGDVYSFNGLVDEPAVYNRALSSDEIQSRYSSSGFVARYSGEGNADDAVGGNNGTLVGGVTFTQGRVGQAFSFDGEDDYVEIADHPNQSPSSITVEAWVNPDTLDGFQVIMSKYQSVEAGNYSWAFSRSGGTLEFGVYQGETGRVIGTINPVLAAGAWQHVAGTFDLATNTMAIYVDGVAMDTTFIPGHDATITAINDATSPVRIGAIANSSGVVSNFWDGRIDEASLYSRALSLAEIQALATGDSPSVPEGSVSEGVVVNLRLDTASGLAGGIARIQNVIGSSGNDILVGNGGNVLNGGAGRDLLIAGTSASTLNGGDGEDLLIAGRTDYDRDAAALLAILAEWTRQDGINDDYASRVANLKNGTNGAPLLNAATVRTVRSNGGGNTLRGNAGRDFFFADMDPNVLDELDIDRLTEELVEL